MTDHPQTATERFLRHGVAGGWILRGGFPASRVESLPNGDLRYWYWVAEEGREYDVSLDPSEALLDPALWQAAGRSLGFGRLSCERCGADAVPVRKDKREAEYYHECCPKRKLNYRKSWQRHWHGLLDHLAAHPGDVDGYLASLLDDDPLPHQEPCNCRDCSLTDAKGTE